MDGSVIVSEQHASLPSLVRRAADQLALATTAAEVLDARDMAGAAYDAAKSAARIARAKGAHDELIAKVHRAQADALEIEAMAKRRLADEYDAAQDRGEVASQGKPSRQEGYATAADLGLSHKDIHEARQIRDAEAADPGIVNRTIRERLIAGHEPTKAAIRRAIVDAVASPSPPRPVARNPIYEANPAADDALTVADCARQIAEVFARCGAGVLSPLRGGHSHALAITKLTQGRDALNAILEANHD